MNLGNLISQMVLAFFINYGVYFYMGVANEWLSPAPPYEKMYEITTMIVFLISVSISIYTIFFMKKSEGYKFIFQIVMAIVIFISFFVVDNVFHALEY